MSTGDPAENPWNCLNCRRRKVRCDRGRPCANCVKGNRDCIFPTSGRMFRRGEPRPSSLKSKTRQGELLDRLRRLESAVDGLNSELLESRESPGDGRPEASTLAATPRRDGHDPSTHIGNPFAFPPAVPRVNPGPARRLEARSTQLQSTVTVADARGGVYVGDRFWATLRQEIKIVRETFAELEDEEADAESGYVPSFLPSRRSKQFDGGGFVFGNDHRKRVEDTLKELRPLPSQAMFLWQTYLDNVSPFLHILHVPTTLKTLQDCRYRFEELDPDMEPLFFAISMAAINTLTDDEVEVNFSRDKEEFLAQLRLGAEQALARADFINTTSISVVQAMTIYVFYIRREESTRYAWSLIGLLVRIAVSIGLHRDGSFFPNLSPFEIEHRRRLWWNILCFEDRMGDGQVSEIGVSEQNFDTLPPMNVNDADLDPAMTAPPTPREGLTDSTFSLIRHDTWSFSRSVKSVFSQITSNQLDPEVGAKKMQEDLNDFQARILSRYGLLPHEPLQFPLSLMFRLNLNSWRLIIKYQPHQISRDSLPDSQSFSVAVSILEDVTTLRHSPQARILAWFLQGHVLWQPYAIILSRIGSLPWDSVAEHGWKVVTTSLADISEAVMEDPFWQPLRILLNRTHRHRAQQLKAQGRSPQTSDGEAPPAPAWSLVRRRTASYSKRLAGGLAAAQGRAAEGPREGGTGTVAPGGRDSPPSQKGKLLNYEAAPVQEAGGQLPWLPSAALDGALDNLDAMEIVDSETGNLNWEDWQELLWAGAPIY